ncbi:hypothetical protein OsJ_08122 [Oryza sativa Japonica Group]|uniref:Uncharacterized protein n=1 Tax=Oryza sativa subsp. japonica TaxID=39947 RepID=B9F2C2_ORYSJ|nr:hypothetical protein OsJ_08122 [Oryza sativa Japonica Group]
MAALEEAGPRADDRRVRQIRHLGRVVAEPVHLLPGRGPSPPPRIARRSRALRRRPPRLPDPPPTPPCPGHRQGNLSSTPPPRRMPRCCRPRPPHPAPHPQTEPRPRTRRTSGECGGVGREAELAPDGEDKRRVRRCDERSRRGWNG